MVNIDGLVLSERNTGETGKSIKLLTKELGCIDVYVRGGRKSKKSLSSTQLFCYSAFSLEEKRDSKNITHYYYNSAEPKEMFFKLRLDVNKTALAYYFADLIKYCAESRENSQEVMRLTLNTLYFLNKGDRNIETLKSIFEIRLFCETGYLPNLLGCCHCYTPESDRMYFSFESGVLECPDCVKNPDSYYSTVLDKTLLYIIRFIALVEYDRLFNFKISGEYQKKLTEFSERFSQYHCGKIDSLAFYKMLK